MSEYRLKTGKIGEAVVKGYKKTENAFVNGYKKIENAVVSRYKKIEDKFIEAYLERGDEEQFVNFSKKIPHRNRPMGFCLFGYSYYRCGILRYCVVKLR